MELWFSSPFNKLIKRAPVGKACLSNLDILYEAEICDLEIKGSLLVSQWGELQRYLMKNSVRLPVPRSLRLVRLDGPDVVRHAGPQSFDQLVGLVLDLGARRSGPFAACSVHLGVAGVCQTAEQNEILSPCLTGRVSAGTCSLTTSSTQSGRWREHLCFVPRNRPRRMWPFRHSGGWQSWRRNVIKNISVVSLD